VAVVVVAVAKLEVAPLLVAAELFFVVVVVRDSTVKVVVAIVNQVSEFVPTDFAQFAAAVVVAVELTQLVSEKLFAFVVVVAAVVVVAVAAVVVAAATELVV
jgi:hypothetical protein